jgi:hypothetical protein
MYCPRCQQENPPGARFCNGCGAPVKLSAGGDASEASYPELQGSLSEALAGGGGDEGVHVGRAASHCGRLLVELCSQQEEKSI